MKCTKCNHMLPEDSEFCQYCGSRIELKVTSPVVETEKMVHNTQPTANDDVEENFAQNTKDDMLNAILQAHAKSTVDAMIANSKLNFDNEDDADFGLVPEKPIFTLALKSVQGEREYLDELYTIKGEKITYSRRGSISITGINGVIDIYDTFLPSGQPYETIYINMYGAQSSAKAPAGFIIGKQAVDTMTVPIMQKGNDVNIKYCSRCGSTIDNKTKKCDGCGKQYFKLNFKPILCTILIVLLCCVGWIGYNYLSYDKALDNEEFVQAKFHFEKIPFSEKLWSLENDYINAGVLWEEGEFIDAYQSFKKIKHINSASVPSAYFDELKTEIYSRGIEDYNSKNYDQAKKYFNTIPDYKRSSDYLVLIDCSRVSFSTWSSIEEYYSKLIELLNEDFANVDEVILKNEKLMKRFLTGRWEDGDYSDPYYFEIYKTDEGMSSSYNLPYKKADGYFFISDGMYKVGETESSAVAYYRFTVIDEYTLMVYCFKDGSTHKMYRQ